MTDFSECRANTKLINIPSSLYIVVAHTSKVKQNLMYICTDVQKKYKPELSGKMFTKFIYVSSVCCMRINEYDSY